MAPRMISGRTLAATLSAASLMVAPTLGAGAGAPEQAGRVSDHYDEGSVLVATRQLEGKAAAPLATTLEPISQHSERTPELAEPPAEPPLGGRSAALLPLDGAPVGTPAPPRVASRPARADGRAAADRPAVPPPADPADVAATYSHGWRVEPARFHGIVPGKSTSEDVAAAWGDPVEVSPTEDGELRLYELPPFDSVEALISGGKVTLIKVELDNQQQPQRLAKRLRLDKFRPVEILDEAGRVVVGMAYPEKGMVLLLAEPSVGPPGASDKPLFVTHMVIQPIDAGAFALRADQAGFGEFEARLADLDRAVSIDPNNAYANWRLAELHRLTGASNKAAAAAQRAVGAEPDNAAYRLCLAACLTEQGDYDAAVIAAREVIDTESAPAVVRAGALHLMGGLASIGEAGIADKAIGFQNMAIGVADSLATSGDRAERREAKRLLVRAHLAVAREISRRKYARKDEVVGQWIGRASGLAEEAIGAGDANLELRLLVARDALAALANLKPAKDPAPWVEEAEAAAGELLSSCRDGLYRSRVEWLLGQAYFHAMRVEHSRKQVSRGLSYGRKSIAHLEAGASVGEIRPAAELLVGRLYFHIGALHAVYHEDHAEAVTWYDRAEPLLTAVAPTSELAVPRLRGEALVSMGLSYWEQSQRDRALALTLAGADLMEQAVAAGVLDEQELGVPYGNLKIMHLRLGDREQAAKFASLAREVKGGAEPAMPPTFAEAVAGKAASKTVPPKAGRQKVSPDRSAQAGAQRTQGPARRVGQPPRTAARAGRGGAKPAARGPSGSSRRILPRRALQR